MPSYPTKRVRVTWCVEPSDDDTLRHDTLNLTHARAAGLADDEAIRRLLAIKYLGGRAAAKVFVNVRHVEPIRSPELLARVARFNAAFDAARAAGHDNAEAAERASEAVSA